MITHVYCQLVVSSCICEEQLHPGCFAPVRENHLARCVLASFKFSQNVYKAVIFQMSTLLSILVEISAVKIIGRGEGNRQMRN